jgi:hypothetical protein
MRNTILIFFLSFTSITITFGQWSNNNGSLSSGKEAEIKWEKTIIDIGEVKQYNPQNVSYKFTNTGGKPIVITSAKGSCGCTEIEYSKKPVLPGQSSNVVITFDAESPGVFNKSVTLTMNIEKSSQVLHLKGTVIN